MIKKGANKIDLVNKISENLSYLAKEDIDNSIDLILEYLQQQLAQLERIEIRGFGSFSIRKRKFQGKDQQYKTVYYRMPSSVLRKTNK